MPTVDELQDRIAELEKRIEAADDYIVAGHVDHAKGLLYLIRKSGETIIIDLSQPEDESPEGSGYTWLGHGTARQNMNAE